jgi:transcriptional regulator with XRE-family HTH domain
MPNYLLSIGDYAQESLLRLEGFDLEGFGERVRARRGALGITQEHLAERTGVAATAVGRWEGGALPRDTIVLARLAVVLQVSMSWLLGEDPEDTFMDGVRSAVAMMRLKLQELADGTGVGTDEFLGELAVARGLMEQVDVVRTANDAQSPSTHAARRPPGTMEGSRRRTGRQKGKGAA